MEKSNEKEISPKWKKPFRTIWFPEPLKDTIKRSPSFESINLIQQKSAPSKKKKEKGSFFEQVFTQRVKGKKKKKRRLMIGKWKSQKGVHTEKFKMMRKTKTENDKQFIFNKLKGHSVFFHLSDENLDKLIQKIFYCEVNPETFLFKQKEIGFTFFIIQKGECDIIIDDQLKAILKVGETFGQLALLYSCPRSASVYCRKKTYLWGIDRITFKKAV